jgi:hypothetical protein
VRDSTSDQLDLISSSPWGNARYPDFEHKSRAAALWLNIKLNPLWGEAELAAMVPGTVKNRHLLMEYKDYKIHQGLPICKNIRAVLPNATRRHDSRQVTFV